MRLEGRPRGILDGTLEESQAVCLHQSACARDGYTIRGNGRLRLNGSQPLLERMRDAMA
jgi:hypothetical protein